MRKRERENPCYICGHYHKYEEGEPCGVCGHRLIPADERSNGAAAQAHSAFSSEIIPGFLFCGSYDNASRSELLKAQGITRILNVSDRSHRGASVRKGISSFLQAVHTHLFFLSPGHSIHPQSPRIVPSAPPRLTTLFPSRITQHHHSSVQSSVPTPLFVPFEENHNPFRSCHPTALFPCLIRPQFPLFRPFNLLSLPFPPYLPPSLNHIGNRAMSPAVVVGYLMRAKGVQMMHAVNNTPCHSSPNPFLPTTLFPPCCRSPAVVVGYLMRAKGVASSGGGIPDARQGGQTDRGSRMGDGETTISPDANPADADAAPPFAGMPPLAPVPFPPIPGMQLAACHSPSLVPSQSQLPSDLRRMRRLACCMRGFPKFGTTIATDAHYLDPQNRARAEVGSPAIVWDAELQAQAERLAEYLAQKEGCAVRRMKEVSGGVNLRWAAESWGVPAEAESAVAEWVREKAHYRLEAFPAGCAEGRDCTHYTQVVWKKTERVGCGTAMCNEGGAVWACRYFPPGNIEGDRPY
ncbi:unnamed protein product [Closterium sp. NIES-64]|nr:unnamed protein product [Closterium sp. NIES-64]